MPTYEYACLSCGTHVEVYQRFSEEPLTVCGVCGGPLRKVFHPAGILFKGSGFYATDSRASRTRERAGSGGGDGEKGESTTTSEKAGSTAGSGSRNGSDSRSRSGSRSESGSTGETGPGTESPQRGESSKKKERKAEGGAKEKSA